MKDNFADINKLVLILITVLFSFFINVSKASEHECNAVSTSYGYKIQLSNDFIKKFSHADKAKRHCYRRLKYLGQIKHEDIDCYAEKTVGEGIWTVLSENFIIQHQNQLQAASQCWQYHDIDKNISNYQYIPLGQAPYKNFDEIVASEFYFYLHKSRVDQYFELMKREEQRYAEFIANQEDKGNRKACNHFPEAGLDISVKDARTNKNLACLATAIVQEGYFSDILSENDCLQGSLSGLINRPGKYTLTVTAPGYRETVVDDIKVEGEYCRTSTTYRHILLDQE